MKILMGMVIYSTILKHRFIDIKEQHGFQEPTIRYSISQFMKLCSMSQPMHISIIEDSVVEVRVHCHVRKLNWT